MEITKKYILLVLAAMLLATTGAWAQDDVQVRRFEFDTKVGATFPLDDVVGRRLLGPQLGLEARWNMDTPFDVGLELYMGSAVRHADHHSLSNRIFSLTVFGDYNFRRGQRLSPFVGLGLGTANCEIIQGDMGTEGSSTMLVPRVGIELWRHLRLTLDTRIARRGYNTVGLSVGYTFGGGKK
ncbi:MAG: outer membrane beta-barrel protein [Prevotella sp.]|nr:outer membrane beta-barrel protein [Prevotella sp.]